MKKVDTQKSNYHVVPHKDGWASRREGAARIANEFGTQADAYADARRLSQNSGGGEVRIHSRDGKIRDSNTIPPKKDPYPPKG
jgi:hypothetical protein